MNKKTLINMTIINIFCIPIIFIPVHFEIMNRFIFFQPLVIISSILSLVIIIFSIKDNTMNNLKIILTNSFYIIFILTMSYMSINLALHG